MLPRVLHILVLTSFSLAVMGQSIYLPDENISKIREKAVLIFEAREEGRAPKNGTGFYVKVKGRGGFIVTVNHFFNGLDKQEVKIRIKDREKDWIHADILKCGNENDLDICILRPVASFHIKGKEALGYFPVHDRKAHSNVLSTVGFCKGDKELFSQRDIEFEKYIYNPRDFYIENIGQENSEKVLNKNTKVFLHSRGRVCGGRSGSPIFDNRGELFGMISQSFEKDGEKDFNIAIPRSVIFEYIREHTKGLKERKKDTSSEKFFDFRDRRKKEEPN